MYFEYNEGYNNTTYKKYPTTYTYTLSYSTFKLDATDYEIYF